MLLIIKFIGQNTGAIALAITYAYLFVVRMEMPVFAQQVMAILFNLNYASHFFRMLGVCSGIFFSVAPWLPPSQKTRRIFLLLAEQKTAHQLPKICSIFFYKKENYLTFKDLCEFSIFETHMALQILKPFSFHREKKVFSQNHECLSPAS